MMEKLIFSKRLLEKAEQLRRSSVSVLEAPAGYGKTTAVTWALEGAETALWYTGVENLPDTSFYWFVRQMAAVDERTVRRIETLGFLNRSNAPLAISLSAFFAFKIGSGQAMPRVSTSTLMFKLMAVSLACRWVNGVVNFGTMAPIMAQTLGL